jgi:hypothetical protein
MSSDALMSRETSRYFLHTHASSMPDTASNAC